MSDETEHKPGLFSLAGASLLFSIAFFMAIYPLPWLDHILTTVFLKFLPGGFAGVLVLTVAGWMQVRDLVATVVGSLFQVAGTIPEIMGGTIR